MQAETEQDRQEQQQLSRRFGELLAGVETPSNLAQEIEAARKRLAGSEIDE